MITSFLKYHKFLLLLLLAASSVIPAEVVNAATLSVSFEQTPLFQDLEVAPGSYVTRNVVVTNSGLNTETVYTSVENTASTGLADMMEISIVSTSTIYYATSTFSSLFAEVDPIALGVLIPGESRTYTYVAGLPSSATNTYQGLSLSFDLVVGFEGGESVTDSGGSSGGGGGGGNSDDSGDGSSVPQGIVAGASDSRNPDSVAPLGRVTEFIKGLVLGDSDSITEPDTTTGTSSSKIVNGAGTTTTTTTSCTLWWLLLLAGISTLWSMLDDLILADRKIWLFRNLGFAGSYVLSLGLGHWLGLIEGWWWVWFGIWVVYVATDHVGHQQIINWSSKKRHGFYAVAATLMVLSGLLFDFPCLWWPFLLIAGASALGGIFSLGKND